MADKHKVTIMVLTVNLRCHRCYLKVKKVLCKFPKIRDQTFDKKANTVTISVVCCNPKKVKIKPPPKSPARWDSSLPKPLATLPQKPPATLLPKTPETPISSQLTAGTWAGFCCNACYHGQRGGLCYFGGPPPPPPPCYWTYGRPVYDRWGGGSYKYCYSSHGDCFIEQNPQACSIL